MLRDGDLLDPESSASKLFRTRFRVPYTVFLKIVQWAKEAFDTSAKDCRGGAFPWSSRYDATRTLLLH